MIPAPFERLRVDSVDATLAALAEHGDEAKLLAGGHSLIPLMRLRLATPAVLVDVGPVDALSYVREDGTEVAIGARTRHRDVATSALVRRDVPLLAAASARIGDPQVRNRGTIGGALAHADAASDLPAVLLALRGSVVVRGPAGERRVAADDLFTGFLETVLEPTDLLTEIRLPRLPAAGWSFQKFTRRAQDWATVGVAAVTGDRPGVGLVNMGFTPQRAGAVEAALLAGATAVEAAATADEGTDPPEDLNGDAHYRRHLARVLTQRALVDCGVG